MPYSPPRVDTRYGAPMGRPHTLYSGSTDPKLLVVRRVRLDAGGYDGGGAYWGLGEKLWAVWGTDDPNRVSYIRAPSWAAAKAQARETFSDVE